MHRLRDLREVLPGGVPRPVQPGDVDQQGHPRLLFPGDSPGRLHRSRAASSSKRESATSARASVRPRPSISGRPPRKSKSMSGRSSCPPASSRSIPRSVEEYGYGKMQNVVTSMDYERLLSATGPYQGEILRASDKKHPQKDRLDSVRRLPAGHPGGEQLLLGCLLHLHPETGDPDQGARGRGGVHGIPQRHPRLSARISNATTREPSSCPASGSSEATHRS